MRGQLDTNGCRGYRSRAGKVDALISEHGAIDIPVNNAGKITAKPIGRDERQSDFESVLDVHVVGAFALTKALVPHMKQRGQGCVLFTASMTSFLGQPLVTGYSAAKSAYLGMIRGMTTGALPFMGFASTVLRRAGSIHQCCVRPLKVMTNAVTKSGDTDEKNSASRKISVGLRFYLASDAAAFVSGQVLVVDGGALIGFLMYGGIMRKRALKLCQR